MGSPTLSLPPALSPWLGSEYQWPCCLSQAWLLHSSMVTQVLPGSCRSRDSMLELASLEQLMHRRMEWCSERRVGATINGFRILEGDHIPSGGQNSAAALTNVQGEPKEYDYEYYDDRKPDSVFVNPHDVSPQQEHLLAGNLAGRVFTTPPPGLTPAPRRQFPPGKIQLDRFPEGFNFNFNSQ